MIMWVYAVGRMLGLGTAGGTRPSLTLAVVGVVSALGWGAGLNPTFAFFSNWLAITVFVVLAIFESSFDKIARLDRVQGRLTMPYRVFAGAAAGAATIPFGWHGVVIGLAVGGMVAWFAQYTRILARPKTVPSEAALTLVSLWEDLVMFAATVLTLVISPVGYGVTGYTVAVYWRVRTRRRDKYRKLHRGRGKAGGGISP
jgi:uncharacterized membrane protein